MAQRRYLIRQMSACSLLQMNLYRYQLLFSFNSAHENPLFSSINLLLYLRQKPRISFLFAFIDDFIPVFIFIYLFFYTLPPPKKKIFTIKSAFKSHTLQKRIFICESRSNYSCG